VFIDSLRLSKVSYDPEGSARSFDAVMQGRSHRADGRALDRGSTSVGASPVVGTQGARVDRSGGQGDGTGLVFRPFQCSEQQIYARYSAGNGETQHREMIVRRTLLWQSSFCRSNALAGTGSSETSRPRRKKAKYGAAPKIKKLQLHEPDCNGKPHLKKQWSKIPRPADPGPVCDTCDEQGSSRFHHAPCGVIASILDGERRVEHQN
jgi:hypothetical protein